MEERPSIWKIGMNSGLIVGLALVIYSFILYMTELHTHKIISSLSYLILIGGIIWAHRTFKSNGDSFMSYGEGLGLGTVVSGVAGLVNGVFAVLYIQFIDPNLMKRVLEEQIVVMQDQGMNQSQVDQVRNIMEIMQTPVIFFFVSFITFVFFGFILSLIISAFTKKNNPEYTY